VEWLQRWWCKKYNRPRKDPLLNEYTLEELMIEFLEDEIEENPVMEFPASVRESGRYVNRTGDALVDKWQEKSALGEPIDFNEAFTSDEARKQFERIKEESRKKYREKHQVLEAVAEAPEDIHDDYTGG
jgi:methyl coenzyme M reductase gamma subunit